jgi:hypothetical protein
MLYAEFIVKFIFHYDTASEVRMDLASRQSTYVTSMTNTYCCVYSVETPEDGQ